MVVSLGSRTWHPLGDSTGLYGCGLRRLSCTLCLKASPIKQWSPRHRVGRMRPLPNLRSTTYFGNSTRAHTSNYGRDHALCVCLLHTQSTRLLANWFHTISAPFLSSFGPDPLVRGSAHVYGIASDRTGLRREFWQRPSHLAMPAPRPCS